MDKANALAGHRNDLIHSALIEIFPDVEAYEFAHLSYRPTIHNSDFFMIELAQTIKITEAAKDIAIATKKFSRLLINDLVPKKVQT